MCSAHKNNNFLNFKWSNFEVSPFKNHQKHTALITCDVQDNGICDRIFRHISYISWETNMVNGSPSRSDNFVSSERNRSHSAHRTPWASSAHGFQLPSICSGSQSRCNNCLGMIGFTWFFLLDFPYIWDIMYMGAYIYIYIYTYIYIYIYIIRQ